MLAMLAMLAMLEHCTFVFFALQFRIYSLFSKKKIALRLRTKIICQEFPLFSFPQDFFVSIFFSENIKIFITHSFPSLDELLKGNFG
jgi:hypothetical protein